jgi:hypothetical protein
MELFQRLVAPLVLKFGIHQEQARRKGVRSGEEEVMSRGIKASIVRNFTTYSYHGRGKYNSREKYSARTFHGKLLHIKTSFLAN